MDADADELARAELRELLIDSVPGPDWSLSESMFARTFTADRAAAAASDDLLPPPQVFGDTPAGSATDDSAARDTGHPTPDTDDTMPDGADAARDVHGGFDDAGQDGYLDGTIDGGWSGEGDVHPAGDSGSDAPGEMTGRIDGYADGAVDPGGLDGYGSVW